MKLVIIIPAFNEEKMIGEVLDRLLENKPSDLATEIVVINDGSEDNTQFEAIKRKVTVLNHLLNRGLGGVLGTGLEYAKRTGADFVITLDADGQHDPKDLGKILSPLIAKQADVIIGSRLIGKSNMKLDRKIINYLANLLNFLLWGIWVTDSQSGYRGFSKRAVEKIEIKMNRMEVSSEFLKEVKRHSLKIKEVPIKAIYTDYSKSKGQKNTNALNIFAKLILHRLVDIR
jgi:glycosyltransferase involved in cell wall biosynthesis